MNDDSNKIRITDDDPKNVDLDPPIINTPPPPNPLGGGSGQRQWGTVSGAAPMMPGISGVDTTGNFLLKSWVYLGFAGLAAAFLAWALCEPTFHDEGSEGFGNYVIFTFLITFIFFINFFAK